MEYCRSFVVSYKIIAAKCALSVSMVIAILHVFAGHLLAIHWIVMMVVVGWQFVCESTSVISRSLLMLIECQIAFSTVNTTISLPTDVDIDVEVDNVMNFDPNTPHTHTHTFFMSIYLKLLLYLRIYIYILTIFIVDESNFLFSSRFCVS